MLTIFKILTHSTPILLEVKLLDLCNNKILFGVFKNKISQHPRSDASLLTLTSPQEDYKLTA